LLAERAVIEELAGRNEAAQESLAAAIGHAAVHAPALVPELRYQEAKFLDRTHNYDGALLKLEELAADPGVEPLLGRRVLLRLGRVALEQGRYTAAIEALQRGLAGPNIPATLMSGRFDLVYAL